jgi:hypothetical protein
MHPVNEQRAKWALNALDTFTVETYGGRNFADMVEEHPADLDDANTAIQDLICSLMHVAVKQGWNPLEIIRRAEEDFHYENAKEYDGD